MVYILTYIGNIYICIFNTVVVQQDDIKGTPGRPTSHTYKIMYLFSIYSKKKVYPY